MGLTLVLEAAVAAALAFPLARNPFLCAAAAIVASCVTHPLLWAVFYDVVPILGAYTTPLLEIAIMAAETLAYRAIATPRWSEAALFSILANAASWGAGELIYALS
jgi:hypothetical protein